MVKFDGIKINIKHIKLLENKWQWAKHIYEERVIFSIYQHTYTLIRKGCPDRNMGKHVSRQFTQEEI